MILALFIFIASVALVCFVAGIAIGRTGREQLRLELANLRGKHETLAEAYQGMRRIASEALQAATEKHFPAGVPPKDANERYKVELFDEGQTRPYASTYIGPEAKNCPACSVSVRAESWPQECPACHCLFGFDEG